MFGMNKRMNVLDVLSKLFTKITLLTKNDFSLSYFFFKENDLLILEYLCKQQTNRLTNLGLNSCRLDDEMCCRIATMIPQPGNKLKYLSLYNNLFGDKSWEALANLFQHPNNVLEIVTLSHDMYPPNGLMALIKSFYSPYNKINNI